MLKFFQAINKKDRLLDKTAYPGFEKGDLLPEFIASILKNKNPEISGEDIFRVMDVCFAIWESYKKRKTIKISYLLQYIIKESYEKSVNFFAKPMLGKEEKSQVKEILSGSILTHGPKCRSFEK